MYFKLLLLVSVMLLSGCVTASDKQLATAPHKISNATLCKAVFKKAQSGVLDDSRAKALESEADRRGLSYGSCIYAIEADEERQIEAIRLVAAGAMIMVESSRPIPPSVNNTYVIHQPGRIYTPPSRYRYTDSFGNY